MNHFPISTVLYPEINHDWSATLSNGKRYSHITVHFLISFYGSLYRRNHAPAAATDITADVEIRDEALSAPTGAGAAMAGILLDLGTFEDFLLDFLLLFLLDFIDFVFFIEPPSRIDGQTDAS